MQNLEQLRAKHALEAQIGTGEDGGDAVAKKVPAMIRENGFLGAMTFAKEKGKGYVDVFNAIITHLKGISQLHGLPADFDGFLRGLCEKDAATLRAVTTEAIAYLNYLRRFQ
jgi:CRISPR type III-B/RAMP module-associated protein Cmr5